jgi:hypothetical protein
MENVSGNKSRAGSIEVPIDREYPEKVAVIHSFLRT